MIYTKRLTRNNIIYYADIFDFDKKKKIGNLIEINTKGMKIIGKNNCIKNESYNFEIVIEPMLDSLSGIFLKANCVWSAKSINPDFYESGFEFENVDRINLALITKLIQEFKFMEEA